MMPLLRCRAVSARAVSARAHCFRHHNTSRTLKPYRRSCIMQAADTETTVTSEMLELAQLLADEAATVTTPLFRAKLVTDIKEDLTPVTDADREAERLMREMVREKLPSHSVFGEEFGYDPGTGDDESEWMWVFDPIDGTTAFITGKPSWGTLIALLHKGKPVLGIIDQPITQERWIGVEGKQTVLNGKPIYTRNKSSLDKAYMYTTTPDMFSGASESAYKRLKKSVLSTSFGADCYGYGLLAAGFVDIVAEADLKPWDYMAMIPIIEGAGGVITDFNDRPLRWNRDKKTESISAWSGEVVAAGSRVLHAECIKTLDFTLSNPNH